METIKIDFSKNVGKIKPMHAVNNGPIYSDGVEQVRENFTTYKAAKIPYARTHDASFCAEYGGEHCVDIHAIFPDFTKNPYDPTSYDFDLTDDYLNTIAKAGTKVFYRLGSKIEHWRKKYGTIVPADFNKWAIVCEHIIRHYNLGWANGFHMDIEYWEIWNEPDGKKPNGDQPNWSGTPEQFYELYKTAARHLKKCFPNLKIGGPACSCLNLTWIESFLEYINADGIKTPLDFFSWHEYATDPKVLFDDVRIVRNFLGNANYTETEMHINEWNYIENWSDLFVSSLINIINMHGAAFIAAYMSVGQKASMDMLMYYDARPCAFNGLFDPVTLEPLKGYYPFMMFSDLYALGNEADSSWQDDELYVTASSDNGKYAAMITHYSVNKEKTASKEITLDIKGENTDGEWTIRLLDKDNTMTESKITVKAGKADITLKPDTVIFITK